MFSNITWGTYWSYTAAATALYYVSLGLVFYRHDLQNLATGKRKLYLFRGAKQPSQENAFQTNASAPGPVKVSANSTLAPDLDQVSQLINELRYEVIPKAGKHATKEKLTVLFSNYLSGIKGNLPVELKNSILQLMAKEAAEQCGVNFSTEELQQLG
ncbi:hypothetical protein [Mucilaginibacter paludis]|uniref:Uncharacterized protein n=1 Tax=Mucilaginibacter paludis DSM 18603 TaxID=714943 RepID=H1YDV1_9SPHI|nr:hypothetical protein [Mucilaginibacter paludis]EHQ24291.1 hypothetical protein Mucpa_0088 [Mucilaginibacter paludis DSM 18603]